MRISRSPVATVALASIALAACAAGEASDDAQSSLTRTESASDTDAPTESGDAISATTTVTIAPFEEDPDDDTRPPVSMPEPDLQWFLRTHFEHTIGSGPGLIERDVGYAPVVLEPGTYTTDAMFTPVTFTLDDDIRLVVERPTFMLLVDQSASELWDTPLVHWIRPRGLVDPARTSDGPPGWPPTVDGWDFDAWFDAHPGIDAVGFDVQIDGVPAKRYDISFPADTQAGWECGDSRCVPFLMRYDRPFELHTSDPSRMWVIPQGDDAPIVIHAAIHNDQEWGRFGEHLGAIIDSIELGEPASVDIPDEVWEAGLSATVPAGPVELPILDGVRFSLSDDHFVNQDRDWSLIELNGDWAFYPANVEVAAAEQAYDFTPIDTAVQLADLLTAEAGASRLPDRELLGRPAVVVEMLGVQPGIPVFRHVDLPQGAHPEVGVWYTQDYVELWAVDTDAGVLIVTAEAANPDELALAQELHEEIRSTLELL